MSRVCQVTKKGPMSGNTVSHSNRKAKRRFLPNLQKRRLWSEAQNRFITVRISSHGLRIIDKVGLEAALSD